MAIQQWSSSHKDPSISLSSSNTIATATGTSAVFRPVFGSVSATTGLLYWEIVIVETDANPGAGIGNFRTPLVNDFVGGSSLTGTVGWFSNGAVWYNNAQAATWATYTSGQILCFALDLVNHKLWGRVTNGNWNNDVIGNQNPATNTGGFLLNAAVYAAPVVPAGNTYRTTIPDSITASFPASSWTYTPPSGFGAWGSQTTITLNTGSGTQQWTPPGNCATIDILELWGPGGSGGKRAGRVTGGGAGAYNVIYGPITVSSLLVAGTVPYLLGQGGAAQSTATTAGNPGTAKTWFSAIGTYAADFGLGGLASGTSGTTAGGAGGLVANCVPTTNAVAGGAGGTDSSASGASGGGAAPSSFGAGVAGAAVSSAVAGAGGVAVGAGTTEAGGGGGAASITSTNATGGVIPGGGGGAINNASGSSGAGAIGQIIITFTPGPYVKALSASNTETVSVAKIKAVNKTSGYSSASIASRRAILVNKLLISYSPWSSYFSSDFGPTGGPGAINAQATAATETKIPSGGSTTNKSLSAAIAESVRSVKLASSLRAVAGTQVAFLLKQTLTRKYVAETQALSSNSSTSRLFSANEANAGVIKRQVSKSAAIQSTYAALVAKVTGALRSLSSGEIVLTSKQMQRLQRTVSLETPAVSKGVGKKTAATDTQALNEVRVIGTVRAVTSAETARALKVTGRALLSASSEVAQTSRQVVKVLAAFEAEATQAIKLVGKIILSTGSVNVAFAIARKAQLVSKSTGEPQAFGVARQTGALRSVGNAQSTSEIKLVSHPAKAASLEAVSVLKGSGKSPAVGEAQAVAAARMLGISRILSAASAESLRVLRSIGKTIPAAETYISHVVKSVAHAITVGQQNASAAIKQMAKAEVSVNAQVLGLIRLASIGRAVSVADAHSAHLLKATGKTSAAFVAQIASSAKAVAAARGSALIGIAGSFRSAGKILAGVSPDLAAAIRGLVSSLRSALAGVASALHSVPGDHSIILGTSSPAGQEALKQAAIARTVAQLQAASQIHWFHEFFPANQRPKRVLLPDTGYEIALPPAHLLSTLPEDGAVTCTLPALITTVVLPTEEEEMSGFCDAEPPFFSPMDPTDENTVTFDWSRRAFPNDQITFATITSVPTGLNFIGPPFINGLLVDITIGPTSPPVMPFSYGVRCTAMFISGRVSSFTIPIEIRPL